MLENILLINLDHRVDRLEHSMQQFETIGVPKENIERFPAIRHNKGAIGCSLSHIHCLEIAKQRNLDSIFISEDDIQFTNPTVFLESLDKFYTFYNELEKNTGEIYWDVLLLAGNIFYPILNQVDERGSFRIQNAQATTGYIVRKHYYDTLLQNFKVGLEKLIRFPKYAMKFAIDMYWKKLQQTDGWFIIAPLTVTQYVNYSDIEKQNTNYEFLMLNVKEEMKVKSPVTLFNRFLS